MPTRRLFILRLIFDKQEIRVKNIFPLLNFLSELQRYLYCKCADKKSLLHMIHSLKKPIKVYRIDRSFPITYVSYDDDENCQLYDYQSKNWNNNYFLQLRIVLFDVLFISHDSNRIQNTYMIQNTGQKFKKYQNTLLKRNNAAKVFVDGINQR